MIRHIWSVLCRSASFDVKTNSVSLLNAVETISVLGEPSTEHPGLFEAELVSLWGREDVEIPILGKMRMNVITPPGDQGTPVELELNLSQTPFHRTRITIPGMPITMTGTYIFRIDWRLTDNDEWSTAASVPLLATSIKGPPAEEASAAEA